MRQKRLLLIFGTRPEAIKLAPIAIQAQAIEPRAEVRICATGQHNELLKQACDVFGLQPHHWLGVMIPNQTLPQLTARLFETLPPILAEERPDWVIVQCDTTSAFVGAMCAFYERIPVAHVEAGLRTADPYAPFPEEINRRLISHIAQYHFAPTQQARVNLLQEGISPDRIYVTGNTVVDAVQWVLRQELPISEQIRSIIARRFVLITLHRRENFGAPLRAVLMALRKLAEQHPEVEWVFPVHPNPNVRDVVRELLDPCANVQVIEPPDYPSFLTLLKHATLVITDSGGVQEEATALGKELLITREVTERPEVLETGRAHIVGTNAERLIQAAQECLARTKVVHPPTSIHQNPFGDGHAARRILEVLLER